MDNNNTALNLEDKDFNITIDERKGINFKGFSVVGGASLSGAEIYRSGSLGLANSLILVKNPESNVMHVPLYAIAKRRGQVSDKNDFIYQNWIDGRDETATFLDKKGILGKKEQLYRVDMINCGLIIANPEILKTAIQNNKLVNYGLLHKQETVNQVLDAVKRDDLKGLTELLDARNMKFAGTHLECLEAQESKDFYENMMTSYFAFTPVEEAEKVPSQRQSINIQRKNLFTNVILGKNNNNSMLDKFEEFEWTECGFYHDRYNNANVGRVVTLYGYGNIGVDGSRNLSGSGRPLVVTPEAFVTFYKHGNLNASDIILNQAEKTHKPVPFKNGVVLYLSNVELKQ